MMINTAAAIRAMTRGSIHHQITPFEAALDVGALSSDIVTTEASAEDMITASDVGEVSSDEFFCAAEDPAFNAVPADVPVDAADDISAEAAELEKAETDDVFEALAALLTALERTELAADDEAADETAVELSSLGVDGTVVVSEDVTVLEADDVTDGVLATLECEELGTDDAAELAELEADDVDEVAA